MSEVANLRNAIYFTLYILKYMSNYADKVIKRWLKSGSFGFAEGSALCVGAKPNVPLVRLAKIVFKKVRWVKK